MSTGAGTTPAITAAPAPAATSAPAPAPASTVAPTSAGVTSAPAATPTPTPAPTAVAGPVDPATMPGVTANTSGPIPTFGANSLDADAYRAHSASFPGWAIAVIVIVGLIAIIAAKWMYSRFRTAKAQRKLETYENNRSSMYRAPPTGGGVDTSPDAVATGSASGGGSSSAGGGTKDSSGKGRAIETLPWTIPSTPASLHRYGDLTSIHISNPPSEHPSN